MKRHVSLSFTGASSVSSVIFCNGIYDFIKTAIVNGWPAAIKGATALGPVPCAVILSGAAILGIREIIKNSKNKQELNDLADRIKQAGMDGKNALDILRDIKDGTIELKVSFDDFVKRDLAEACAVAVGEKLEGEFSDSLIKTFGEMIDAAGLATEKHLDEFWENLEVYLNDHKERIEISNERLADIGREIEGLRDYYRKRPPLELRLSAVDPDDENQNLLVYRVRRTPMFGREREIGELEEFINDNEKKRAFSWWFWIGAGGMGKSRLALEFCLKKMEDGWRVGFLPSGRINSVESAEAVGDWVFDRPTLIVVDYVVGRAESLGKMVRILAERKLEHPVRVLFLERDQDAQSQWWKDLIHRGQSTDRELVRKYYYDQSIEMNARELCGLDDYPLWEMMEKIFKEEKGFSLPGRDETIARVRKIDSAGRPLYAALCADAIVKEGGLEGIRGWDQQRLMGHVLAHEEQRWEKLMPNEGKRRKYLDLLAFATMVHGIKDDNRFLYDDSEVHKFIPGEDEIKSELYMSVCGSGEKFGGGYPPMEPDLLGEAFVIQRLKGRSKGFVEKVIQAAWRGNPFEMGGFLVRLMEDFGDRTDDIRRFVLTKTISESALVLWIAAGVEGIFALSRKENAVLAQELIETIDDVYKNDLSTIIRETLRMPYAVVQNSYSILLEKITRYEEAETRLLQALEIDEEYIEAHTNLANLYSFTKRFVKAEVHYKRALEIDDKYAKVHNCYATMLSSMRRFAEAEASYKRAIEIDDKDVETHNNYANLLKKMGRLSESETQFKQALEINPELPEVHSNYSILLSDMKRWEEAEEHCKWAIRINVDYIKGHINYANLLTFMKRFDDAEAEYKLALEINEEYAAAHNNYGILLSDMGRIRESEIHYKRALEINDEYAKAYNNYAGLLHKTKRFKEAEEHIQRALKINEEYAEAHFNYANMLSDMNRFDDAEMHYLRALEINEGYAECFMAFVYLLIVKRNDFSNGLHQFNRAILARRLSIDNVRKIVSWFRGKKNELVAVIRDIEKSTEFRGCTLLILAAIDPDRGTEITAELRANTDGEPVIKSFWETFQQWKEE